MFVFNHCYHQKWHAYKQNRDISVNHLTNINFDLFTNFLLLLFIKYLWFFSCLGCFSFWTNMLKLVHLLGLLLHWYMLVSLDRWCTEIGFYIVILILGSTLILYWKMLHSNYLNFYMQIFFFSRTILREILDQLKLELKTFLPVTGMSTVW